MIAVIEETELRDYLGKQIRRLRVASGVTQQELADQVGLSLVSMNRIERGLCTPKAHTLYRLADALGVSADALRQIS